MKNQILPDFRFFICIFTNEFQNFNTIFLFFIFKSNKRKSNIHFRFFFSPFFLFRLDIQSTFICRTVSVAWYPWLIDLAKPSRDISPKTFHLRFKSTLKLSSYKMNDILLHKAQYNSALSSTMSDVT